ncbi:MAG: hypothetical protein A2V83_09345 [Nitrospirae bacterium RBG_16_64_22]|nr:MAG: hypothetical protein A2V83_09345 [Nitrospirae bacterium RBG_16_64_22]
MQTIKESELIERLHILEKSISTLTSAVEKEVRALDIVKDLEKEIKTIKLFLSQSHPDFKTRFPEIFRKI